MSSLTLRHLVQVLATFVWVRHLGGATRTFSMAKGERPSPKVQLFVAAIALLVYASFNSPLERRLVAPGVACLLASLALFEWARRSIRGRFFSYVYSNDTPEFVWTFGPFAYVRNPFYASYMLSYLGAALVFPGWLTLTVVAAMGVFFVRAAQHEERKFERSPLAAEYASYKKRTGRFIPRLP